MIINRKIQVETTVGIGSNLVVFVLVYYKGTLTSWARWGKQIMGSYVFCLLQLRILELKKCLFKSR